MRNPFAKINRETKLYKTNNTFPFYELLKEVHEDSCLFIFQRKRENVNRNVNYSQKILGRKFNVFVTNPWPAEKNELRDYYIVAK